MGKVVLDWKTAHDFIKDAFVGVGVPADEAEIKMAEEEGVEIRLHTIIYKALEEMELVGLPPRNVTRNLHENGIVGIMTGYEEKFHALGTPINRCEVVTHPIMEEVK